MSNQDGPLILVLGPQGSGKGTQVELLAKEYQLPTIAAGDLFREAALQPTDLGRAVKSILEAGQLMTVALWEQVVGAWLDRTDMSRGYLLDGVLRSLEQLDRFSAILVAHQLNQPWAISITLDDEIATTRLLKRGRNDDTPAQIRVRLAWSRTQVQPVVERLRAAGRLVEVDGNQSIDEVHRAIVVGLTAIGALPKSTFPKERNE